MCVHDRPPPERSYETRHKNVVADSVSCLLDRRERGKKDAFVWGLLSLRILRSCSLSHTFDHQSLPCLMSLVALLSDGILTACFPHNKMVLPVSPLGCDSLLPPQDLVTFSTRASWEVKLSPRVNSKNSSSASRGCPKRFVYFASEDSCAP